MTQDQYRKRWIRRHGKYEKQAYKIFIGALRDMANNIPFDTLTESNYDIVVSTSIKIEDLQKAYFDVYNSVGKQEGIFVGNNINKQIKEWTTNAFLSEWDKRLLSWLFENSSYRIVTVQNDYIDFIRLFLTNGINEGKTIQELAKELQLFINKRNFYRYQALRIARTETTAAANYAATVSAGISGVVTDKIWISSQDARTRRPPKSPYNHFVMNGVKVGKDEPFNVSGQELMFPGDPKGAAGNVINCRCSSAIVPRRDKNGRIIRSV